MTKLTDGMDQLDIAMMTTMDPKTVIFDGKPCPALTTLLYRVCNNDLNKFEEATRLVKLFMEKARSLKD